MILQVMREHALFALKHILANNPENQALVAALKPTGTWDADGILKDSKGDTRR
jgi:ataxin-10